MENNDGKSWGTTPRGNVFLGLALRELGQLLLASVVPHLEIRELYLTRSRNEISLLRAPS